jgi:hypothetical protein
MTKSLLKIGMLIFLGVSLSIPKVYGQEGGILELKDTVFMNPDDWIQRWCVVTVDYEDRDDYSFYWSYKTYDSPFMVQVFDYNKWVYHSENKTEDSGMCSIPDCTLRAEFSFRNIDNVSGYIDIHIYVVEDLVIGSNKIIFICMIISLTSLITIFRFKRRQLKKL